MNRDIYDDLSYARDVLAPANPEADPSALPTPVTAWVTRGLQADFPLPDANDARRTRRRAPVIVAAGLVAAAVAAVALSNAGTRSSNGAAATSGSGARAVLAAYSATQQANTAKATFSASAGRYSVTGSATGDLSTGEGQITIDLPPPVGQLQALSVGGSYYLEVPQILRALDGGKAWARIDRTTVEQLIGTQLGSPSLVKALDPSRALELLKSVSGPVATIGAETLPGDTTPSTHYRAMIDLSKVDVAGPGTTAPADLWLDTRGRLRKLTVLLDLSKVRVPARAESRVPKGIATATLELTDYGTPVTVTAPPADQVGDLGPIGSFLAGAR